MLFIAGAKQAEELTRDSIRLKEVFQQQTYAKFCVLLNSKKQKIRELEARLQQLEGLFLYGISVNHMSNVLCWSRFL